MIFLRDRNGNTERAYVKDDFTAKDKAHALFVLGGAVVVARHPYDRDPHSGASNCWCGNSQSTVIHDVTILSDREANSPAFSQRRLDRLNRDLKLRGTNARLISVDEFLNTYSQNEVERVADRYYKNQAADDTRYDGALDG